MTDQSDTSLRLALGYRFRFSLSQPTPMIALLKVHGSAAASLETPDLISTAPQVPLERYRDGFGNSCTRLVAPAGVFEMSGSSVIHLSGEPDPPHGVCAQSPVEEIEAENLVYLLPSRYCDSDLMTEIAWARFAPLNAAAPHLQGSALVQQICDYVHHHIRFDYASARATRTASEAHEEARGVCRDFTHLAITLCRCMNIPARYCTGYISDIGTATPDALGDFAAWMEVYLGGAWRMYDPRNNVPRVGRVLVARGRDAADVPLVQSFGRHELTEFSVLTRAVI